MAAAPRVVFAGVVFAAAFVVRGAAFVAAGALGEFGAVDLVTAAPVAVAVLALDFAVAGLLGAVLLAAVLPAAFPGLALLAVDLLSAGAAAALAAFPVGAVLPDAFAGALAAAVFTATGFGPALADPVAFAVVDAFLPVRPDAAPADPVASVVPCAVRARAGAVRATPALSAITHPLMERQPPIYETTGAAWPRTAKAGKDTEPKAGRQHATRSNQNSVTKGIYLGLLVIRPYRTVNRGGGAGNNDGGSAAHAPESIAPAGPDG
ncbi:MAG TPA: hypothetical protein VIR00_04180 [Micromonosporaceae bacterium]